MASVVNTNNCDGGQKKVLVIFTGGTIGMIKNESGILVPAQNMLEGKIRTLPQMHDASYQFNQDADANAVRKQQSLMPLALPSRDNEPRVVYWIKELNPLLDSSNVSVPEWINLANIIKEEYEKYDGFVVLHGTDTLAYTASALSFMLSNLAKTVIITAAQVTIFENRNDALNNFLSSLILAGTRVIPEVGVYFGHKLYRGNRLVKVHSINAAHAFDSPNCPPLAIYDLDVTINTELLRKPDPEMSFTVNLQMCKNVCILKIFPTIQPFMIQGVLGPSVKGVVLETFGAGDIPNHADLLAELLAASRRGVIIVNCTQCLRGPVRPIYATGQPLLHEAGVIAGYDMTPQAALTKLAYVLSRDDWDLPTKRQMMGVNMRGELSS